MPVQINEVVISATVTPEESDKQKKVGSNSRDQTATPYAETVAEIIEEILKEKKER